MRAADLFEQGVRPAEIARQVGVCHQIVSDWRAVWRQSGRDGLRGAGRAGRLPKLSREQLGQVEVALAKGAEANGYPNDVWTLKHVADVIERVTGVSYNDETLIEFLSELNDFEQRRVVLIWDGLPSHRSGRMRAWVASQRHWLSVEPLPGYAPELNPIEQVWGNLKSTELANLCSDTINEVAGVAEDGLYRIGSDVSLCFSFGRPFGCQTTGL